MTSECRFLLFKVFVLIGQHSQNLDFNLCLPFSILDPMQINKFTWLFLLTIVALLACKKDEIEVPPSPANSSVTDLEKYLTVQKTAQNLPALATLIFKEDQILFENYQGLTEIEK